MKPLNYRTQAEIDAIPNAAVRAYADQPDIDSKELSWVMAEVVGSGGAPSNTVTVIYDSAAVDATDFHQDAGQSTDIPFIADADDVWLSKAGAVFTALQDIPLLELDCTVATTDSAVNNRAVYRLDVQAGARTYKGTSMFIRDDAASHDSGSVQRTASIRGILAGQTITVRMFVMDAQSGGNSVAPVDTNESHLLMTVVS